MRARTLFSIATFTLLASCRRDSSNAAAQVDAAPPPAAVDPQHDAAGASTAADEKARAAVFTWSKALDQHDTSGLEALYGENVTYYGTKLARVVVLNLKKKALSDVSTFHQEIVGDVTIDPVAGGARATFLKRSGPEAKPRDVHAILVLRARPEGELVVVEETDEPTEKHLRDKREAACEDVASAVVTALPEVKSHMDSLARVLATRDGGARVGGVGPLPSEEGGFSAGFGVHTDQRFEGHVWYTVDPAGKLGVTVFGAELPVPPAAAARVEQACR